MNHSRTIRTSVAAGLALGLIFGLSSCGKAAEKLSEKATEKAIEKAAGGNANVDIDPNDGTFSIETDEGSFQMGGGDIPADWPSDIPLPKGFEPQGNMNMSSNDEVNITLHGLVPASVDETAAFYADALSSWDNEGTSSMSNSGVQQKTLMFKRGNESLIVNVTDSTEDSGTGLNFIYTSTPDEG